MLGIAADEHVFIQGETFAAELAAHCAALNS